MEQVMIDGKPYDSNEFIDWSNLNGKLVELIDGRKFIVDSTNAPFIDIGVIK